MDRAFKMWLRIVEVGNMELACPAWLGYVGAILRKLSAALRKGRSALVGLKYWPEFSKIIKIMFKIVFYPCAAVASILILVVGGVCILYVSVNWHKPRKAVEFLLPPDYLPKYFDVTEIILKPQSRRFKVAFEDTYFFDLEYLTPGIAWGDFKQDREIKNKIITAIQGHGIMTASGDHTESQRPHLIRATIHRLLSNGQRELCFSRSGVPSVNLLKSSRNQLLANLAEVKLIPGRYELTLEARTSLMLPLVQTSLMLPWIYPSGIAKFSIWISGATGSSRDGK